MTGRGIQLVACRLHAAHKGLHCSLPQIPAQWLLKLQQQLESLGSPSLFQLILPAGQESVAVQETEDEPRARGTAGWQGVAGAWCSGGVPRQMGGIGGVVAGMRWGGEVVGCAVWGGHGPRCLKVGQPWRKGWLRPVPKSITDLVYLSSMTSISGKPGWKLLQHCFFKMLTCKIYCPWKGQHPQRIVSGWQ